MWSTSESATWQNDVAMMRAPGFSFARVACSRPTFSCKEENTMEG